MGALFLGPGQILGQDSLWSIFWPKMTFLSGDVCANKLLQRNLIEVIIHFFEPLTK